MVCIKFFAVLLCYLLVQVQCESVSNDGGNDKDIIDIAKAALRALEEIVDGVTKISLITLDTLESVIRSVEELVLKVAKVEINQIGDQIFAKLDELKKGANIIVVDIIDCTEDREADLKTLLMTFLNETGDCAVKRIDEVLDSLTVVVKDVQNVNEEVKNFTAQLETCETASNVTACVLKVIEDMEKAAAEIPAKITKDVTEAKKRVDELINYLFECEHNTINELQMKLQEIYNGIVECVEGKVLPPSVVYL